MIRQYKAADNPKHQAELAAERILLASATLLRNTLNRKPIQAKRHAKRMVQELPLVATHLGPERLDRLKKHMQELATAYETGSAESARTATRWIKVYLYTLCH